MVYVSMDVSKITPGLFKAEHPEFLDHLRHIGELQVADLQSTPPNLDAFKAWCKLFVPAQETLKGSDGGEWTIAKEFTYPVFLECLKNTPKGKAVGAGRFSIELLLHADNEVKFAFYEALMADVKELHFDSRWRRVLYALLAKPPPNDPNKVSGRREIALMAQDMKLLMQMVRGTTYRRLVERVASEQMGWLPGYGATDPALTLTLVIQQSARLQHALYIFWIDLATFSSRIDRRVSDVANALLGLPDEIQQLTAAIFSEIRGDSVQCQYDSAAGLGEPFSNHMGRLMGDVLAPDQAKILLNSVICAIRAVAKGVTLYVTCAMWCFSTGTIVRYEHPPEHHSTGIIHTYGPGAHSLTGARVPTADYSLGPFGHTTFGYGVMKPT